MVTRHFNGKAKDLMIWGMTFISRRNWHIKGHELNPGTEVIYLISERSAEASQRNAMRMLCVQKTD